MLPNLLKGLPGVPQSRRVHYGVLQHQNYQMTKLGAVVLLKTTVKVFPFVTMAVVTHSKYVKQLHLVVHLKNVRAIPQNVHVLLMMILLPMPIV